MGFAPLSEAERLVLGAENYLNSADFKRRFPETGEDVKVMSVRSGRSLQLTIAMAFVDRFIAGAAQYFERKAQILDDLQNQLAPQLHDRVARRLEQMAAVMKMRHTSSAERGLLPLERPPQIPSDPRPPLPGRDGPTAF